MGGGGGGGSVRLTFYSMINAAAPRQPGNPAETQKLAAAANDMQTSFCFMKVTPDL